MKALLFLPVMAAVVAAACQSDRLAAPASSPAPHWWIAVGDTATLWILR